MTADEIITALLELDDAIAVLEQSVTVLERAHAPGSQRDLFGNWIGDAPEAANDTQQAAMPQVDTALLSRKLDAAIDRVQQILNEAA